jgi:transposase
MPSDGKSAASTALPYHLSRKLRELGHDARLMPAKYVRPYSKGQKNDFRDAETIAEAVQRPTMKFVATKTADQLDLQALHRVRERLVSQRTGIINQKSLDNDHTFIEEQEEEDADVTDIIGGDIENKEEG